MIYGTLITENKSCIVLDKILGFEGENNSNKIIFNFKDGFIDGYGVLAVKRGKDNGTIELDKVGESYIFTVKSSVLSQVGDIEFQVVITQDDGTVYKYSTFIMTVNDAIDTDIPLPEEYPSWINMANAKLAEVDKAIENAEAVGKQLLEDKENGVFNGKDGKDGVDGKDGANGKDGTNGIDGISPVAKIVQTETGAIITVVDADGTTTAQLTNGKDGADGKDGINGTNGKDGFSPVATVTQTDTGATISITDTNGTTTAIVRNGKDGESGILEETDPVYLADKPNIALKSELPTKVSELQNDSGYLTEYTETDPTIPTHVKNITQENINNWNNKSEFSGSYNDLTDKPTIPSIEGLATAEQLTQGLATKQDTLTPGNNITIENGVISATGGGGGITELPIASSTTLGGIKVGDGLKITEDGILSALGGGNNSSLTTLFNGEFSTIATMSDKNLLSDSVYNYDYIILTMYQLVPSNKSKARVTSFIVDPLYTPATTSTGSQQWNANCYDLNASSGMGYYMTGNFGDGTQLCISAVIKEPGVADRTHGICKVVGIKLGSGTGGGSSYKETELLSAPAEYTQGGTSGTTIGQDLSLLDSIENYDEIVFCISAISPEGGIYHPKENSVHPNNIVYNNSDTNKFDGSRFTINTVSDKTYNCGLWFKDSKTIRIHNTFTNTSITSGTKFKFHSIKGIKY